MKQKLKSYDLLRFFFGIFGKMKKKIILIMSTLEKKEAKSQKSPVFTNLWKAVLSFLVLALCCHRFYIPIRIIQSPLINFSFLIFSTFLLVPAFVLYFHLYLKCIYKKHPLSVIHVNSWPFAYPLESLLMFFLAISSPILFTCSVWPALGLESIPFSSLLFLTIYFLFKLIPF